MVALIETHDWTPVTSHTTFLTPTGHKAAIDPQRLFSAGANPAGAGVWATRPRRLTLEMIVAEGNRDRAGSRDSLWRRSLCRDPVDARNAHARPPAVDAMGD